MKIGILHSTIRGDEKLLIQSARKRNIEVELIDIRKQNLNPETFQPSFDVALERSVSTVKGSYMVSFLESVGVNVVNSSAVARLCEDKFLTSLVLQQNDVHTPRFAMAFTEEQAIQAVDEIGGYPVIVKPAQGSWGRLLAKINDEDALQAVLEHKDVLGSPLQKAFYIQEYIEKPGRDIRTFCIDGEVIGAIYRDSSHWITNTARGGKASNCPVTPELQKISQKASDAVGGGILAMDVFETNNGFSINEINHTMEFKNSEEPTGVDISGKVIEYCINRILNDKS